MKYGTLVEWRIHGGRVWWPVPCGAGSWVHLAVPSVGFLLFGAMRGSGFDHRTSASNNMCKGWLGCGASQCLWLGEEKDRCIRCGGSKHAWRLVDEKFCCSSLSSVLAFSSSKPTSHTTGGGSGTNPPAYDGWHGLRTTVGTGEAVTGLRTTGTGPNMGYFCLCQWFSRGRGPCPRPRVPSPS